VSEANLPPLVYWSIGEVFFSAVLVYVYSLLKYFYNLVYWCKSLLLPTLEPVVLNDVSKIVFDKTHML
jgi:hypothetical protein